MAKRRSLVWCNDVVLRTSCIKMASLHMVFPVVMLIPRLVKMPPHLGERKHAPGQQRGGGGDGVGVLDEGHARVVVAAHLHEIRDVSLSKSVSS